MDATDLNSSNTGTNVLVSLVVRTLNEARYLPELLQGVAGQQLDGLRVETVVIDSGSSDGTLRIAQDHGCVITHIRREEFSFGRSLNRGCEAACGDILVFVSGHCVPTDEHWLQRLCQPILDGQAAYTYGRQLGGPDSRYSECRIFEKYYPAQSRIPQQGFFCNNANSALARQTWSTHRFDEELTGLEDMELAKRLVAAGGKVGYVAEAAVYHHHMESWSQVQRRFEREAIALQKIMPQIHVGLLDTARYIASSIQHDVRQAKANGGLKGRLQEIMRYRVAQYSGSYKGNHEHRKLSRSDKDHYFYPSDPLERL
jgi:rhamnosyltransferase